MNLLKDIFPNIYNELDIKKNNNLEQITYRSGKKVWWLCPLNHSYQATVANRTGKDKSGCPYCANQKILPGFNDLLTLNKELCNEWNYEKNTISPNQVFSKSRQYVYWKCTKGHSWKAQIHGRAYGAGCPKCNNNKTSFGEQCIYYYLKDLKAINRYKYENKEIDIYLPEQNIGIEFNGLYYHRNKQKKDKEKEMFLSSNNINMFYICESTKNRKYKNKIYFDCKHKYNQNLSWAINTLFNILKFNIKINLEEDKQNIYSLSIKNEYKNSLAYKYPSLLKEWDYSKNKISPEMITYGSNKKVYWKCTNNHSWEETPNIRVSREYGCPYCSGRRVTKDNNLLVKFPEICKEWDYSKNELSPDKYTFGSAKKVYWRCAEGHEWFSPIYSRTSSQKSNCPICYRLKYVPYEKSFGYNYPDLLKEWDFDKNEYDPNKLASLSSRKVYWKCSNNHSYICTIRHRVQNKVSCPYCNKSILIPGENDLLTLQPEICKEWNFNKNVIKPNEVKQYSHKKVWWTCNNGHEWLAIIANRVHGSNCPYCSKSKLKQSE